MLSVSGFALCAAESCGNLVSDQKSNADLNLYPAHSSSFSVEISALHR